MLYKALLLAKLRNVHVVSAFYPDSFHFALSRLILCHSLVCNRCRGEHWIWTLIINILLGLVRFVPRGRQNSILIGEPLNSDIDVGKEVRNGHDVKVKVFSGTSVLDAGSETGVMESIDRILSPLAMSEVGTIRCIGLNVRISNRLLESDNRLKLL